MFDVTEVLSQIESGDPATDEHCCRWCTEKPGPTLQATALVHEASHVDVLALSDALDKLKSPNPRKASLVKLRYLAGLTN